MNQILPSLSDTAQAGSAGTAEATCSGTHTDRASQPPQLDSRDVLRGHPAVAIHHNGALYRLQTTRQGKLILTK
jgi:hemin uptake protein HemP